MNKVKIFITGGTIDNINYKSSKKLNKSYNSCISKLIKQGNVTIDHDLEILMFKDSRLIDEHDLILILGKCKRSKISKIIITHGTVTMDRTAKFLGKSKIKKTIVLVGSKIPAMKRKSDALFNLGAAIIAVQLLPYGVYVVMNGRIFKWNDVKKNAEKGTFETIR